MNKPYIKKTQFIIEIVSYLFLFAAIVYAIVMACTIEGEIPTHWDLSGEIDGYGSPASMLILPLIMFVSNVIISISLHFAPASSWNLPCKPKPGRELLILSDMVWMMVWMEFILGIYTLVATIGFQSFQIMMGSTIVMVVLLFVVTIAGIYAGIKHNK